jgi:hypothetical protein
MSALAPTNPGKLFICGVSKVGALGLGEAITSAKVHYPRHIYVSVDIIMLCIVPQASAE